ncbi:Ultraviolet-B receptor UVR8 (Protein UV-B RESISTANCE 8) (RCC1 domain-containing protein UVR8) [Durusdinium trenchii]|uniref:Ultraviolet-B receptor UVR8 (Protein UV-B RESISTANCE 8) (RCC1 domain-containing protein UVR8) n=1 Tax=Durusdinium trenchii TaxID=1381693 RepID=A0ABP0SEG3_9DINO
MTSRTASKSVAIADGPKYREQRPAALEEERSETHSAWMTTEQDAESLKSWPSPSGEEVDAFDVVELSCSTTHCFARTAGGHIYGWGSNSYGELGFADDSQSYFWVPKELMIPGKNIKQVCCGQEFTLAITFTGEIWSWGKGSEGQLGLGHCRDEGQPCRIGLENVLSCAAGEQHSAAIAESTDGRVLYTWGMADSGMLGLGGFITCGPCSMPTQVEFDFGKNMYPTTVRCGPSHTGVICNSTAVVKTRREAEEDNALYTFGNGWYGRLGLGDTKSQFHPMRVKLPKSLRDVSLGTDHTAAITWAHELYAWGKASLLGEVQHVLNPKKFSIEGSSEFRNVVCGGNETFVIDQQGRLFAWGANQCGQLGIGQQAGSFVQTASHVKPIHDPVASVVSGDTFTIARLVNGDVLAWGSQSCGRLGLVEVKEERICWDPSLVVATWSTAAAVSAKKTGRKNRKSMGSVRTDTTDAEEVPQAKQTAGKDKTANVVSFVMLQTVLQQESNDHSSAELKRYAEQLEQTAKEIVWDIQKLKKEEEPLLKLEAQLSDSLKMNLRWFRGLVVPDASTTLLDARLPHHLATYARMCWILQQQTTYLTQLSQYLHGFEADIFLETVDALFGDVNDERQLHLFNSLQTRMIAKEAENAGGSPEKFMDKRDSIGFMVFSRRFLRQAFAKDVLWPFLGSKDSILELVGSISSSANSTGFCLSYADFKEKLGADGRGKDEVELNNLYSGSLKAFRDFLTGGFLDIIRKIQLPRSMQLALRQVALASQRWKDSSLLADIEKEQRPYQPALRLFCYGIIEPIMRDGAQYAVPANFLKKSAADYKPDDPQIASNFDCIADFLDKMLSNTIDPKEKALISAARLIKEELLAYVRRQSEVEDTTGPDILGATLQSHYSREKSFVTMSQAHIMKLSNLLLEWSNKLRIKEHDQLDACVKSIPEWNKETITISERYEVRLNFEINTRFMITEEEIRLCKQSMCPLPEWACSANASHRLVYIEEEATGNDQGAFFESLFQRLGPLESKNFATLRLELMERRQQLASGGSDEEGYLQMINDLDTAVQQITELMDVGAEPRQLLDLLVERVRVRQRQFRYLEMTDSHLKSILERQGEYKKDLKLQMTELKDAVDFSLSMKLPQTLQQACHDFGVTSSFQIIQKKMEFVPTLMATKDMAEIGCSYIPMATYPVAKLKKMKVLVEVCPPHNALQKMMEITFKKLDAQAVEITVSVAQGSNKNVIKKITLEPAKLKQLRAAKNDEIAEFGIPGEAPFMTCNASNFVSLLTKIEKGKS